MKSGLKIMLIIVTIVENVINASTATSSKLIVSSVKSPETQLITIPIGIVKVVPLGIGTRNRNAPIREANTNFQMYFFSTGLRSTAVTSASCSNTAFYAAELTFLFSIFILLFYFFMTYSYLNKAIFSILSNASLRVSTLTVQAILM